MRFDCVFFLIVLHLFTVDAINGVEYLNQSQGKKYLYFKQRSTRDKAIEVCKSNNMKLLSVEQHAEKNWLEKIIGNILHRSSKGNISAFVCEKDYVRKINNFRRRRVYPFDVYGIFQMSGNRVECAIHCSELLHCNIFTYVRNVCELYTNYTSSGSKLACDRLHCYVKQLE